ncbi:MAG TPA: DUF2796 domain-containing protein [Alphaproteobacteria bacterium]|nr:DUF2796 domain-containing protein [Alphaproteobacteria bacterium]
MLAHVHGHAVLNIAMEGSRVLIEFIAPGAPRIDLAAGEAVLLLGPSGSGKPTLLALVSGIVRLDVGSRRRA